MNNHFKPTYRDEYTNEQLSEEHIRDAIHDEIDYFNDHVWVGVSMEEALADPEAKLINTRWVNCDKGDPMNPDVRARRVAQEISHFHDESFYAATPPLEAKRLLFSQWATHNSVTMPVSN